MADWQDDLKQYLGLAQKLQEKTGLSGEAMMDYIERARVGDIPGRAAEISSYLGTGPLSQDELALLQRYSQGQMNILPGGPAVNIPINALYEADKAIGQYFNQPAGYLWGAWRGFQGLPQETGETTSKASLSNFLMSAAGSLNAGEPLLKYLKP